ncbi:hypothetical protein AaE_016187 [Aphanomyces astaci]|uniref:DDE-1 domain-containing protein n=1 Tax=Aphanomyces astaci TaxID=112090 RepID=A0A6A4YXB5_APHAT|nr:hypothetical protein AaE_016187 [Aphanomyces astaci]
MLPANTTAFLQLQDAGVIQAFKNKIGALRALHIVQKFDKLVDAISRYVAWVIALCTFHNYIRISGVDCGVFEAQAAALIRQQRDMPLNQNERPQFANEPDSEEAKVWRDQIASQM